MDRVLRSRVALAAIGPLVLGLAVGCTYDPESGRPELGESALGGPAAPAETGDSSTDTGDTDDTGTGDGRRVTILHTNDWQSHMLGHSPNSEYTPTELGDDETIGGVARLETLVEQIRDASEHPVVLYDGGDWMAGTLFQMLNVSHAPELWMMQQIGYDAITIGNHDFDWGPNDLGRIIERADAMGVSVPILAANLRPDPGDEGDDILEALFDSGRIQSARIDTLDNGVRVGLIGLLGDIGSLTASAPTQLVDFVWVAQSIVPVLRASGADLVVAITHAGIRLDPNDLGNYLSDFGDLDLANSVDGIDVIVGGHSHTPLEQPLVVNGTIIVQAGARTEWLGQLDLLEAESGWILDDYALHTIDDTIPGDPEIIARTETLIEDLNDELAMIGLSFDEPIAEVSADVTMTGEADTTMVPCSGESALGNLVTDAYVSSYNGLYRDELACTLCSGAPCDACGLDLAFEVNGSLRADIFAGNSGVQAISDIFRVLSLGLDPQGGPGYPMTHFYITPEELKVICEVGVDYTGFGCSAFIEYSEQVRCEVDMSQEPGSRVTRLELFDGQEWIEYYPAMGPKQRLHVSSNIWHHTLGSQLGKDFFHLFYITPTDADGVAYDMSCEASLDAATGCAFMVDGNPEIPGMQYYRPWEALVDYLVTFEDADRDGIPELPERYLSPQGRLIGYGTAPFGFGPVVDSGN